MKRCLFSALLFLCTFSGIAQSGNSLHFDGVNDNVNIPSTTLGNFVTLEAWIKTPNAGTGFRGVLVQEFKYGIFLNNNQLMTYNWTASGNPGANTYTGVSLNDNQWHHVAVTFEAGVTGGTQMYLDGQAVGAPLTHFLNGNTTTFRIGSNNNADFFAGNIDNVKVWTRKLSAAEINETYNCGVVAATNLVRSYNFNQGIAGQNNVGLTSLTDLSGNNFNGTLSNFALTGSTSNWVGGWDCCFQSKNITGNIDFCLGQTINLNAAFNLKAGQSITSYQWKKDGSNLLNGIEISGANAANLQITNINNTHYGIYRVIVGTTCGIDSFEVNVQNAANINITNLTAYYPLNGNSNDISGNNYNGTATNTANTANRFDQINTAFSFNGTNSDITIGAPTGQTILGNGQNKSISLWFKRATNISRGMLIAYQNTIPTNAYNPLAYIDNGGILRGRMAIGVNNTWSSGMVIDTNWHNLILVYTTNTQTAYLDGAQVGTQFGTIQPGTSNEIKIGNGYAVTTDPGISVNGNQHFQGSIDEVRIYNKVLTLAEINQLASRPFNIVVQPQPVCVSIGSSASLNISVLGNVSYQWQKNGVNINGATNAIFTIPNVQESDFGNYRCIVSSECDNIISSTSREVIFGNLTSVPQPSRVYTFNNTFDDRLLTGGHHSVTVNAGGTQPTTYVADRFGAASSAIHRGSWFSIVPTRSINQPNVTISMWVNLNNSSGTHVFLAPTTNVLPYHLFAENRQLKIRPTSGVSNDIIIPYLLPATGWAQITMVYQGNTNIVYVNGQHIFTTTNGINPSVHAIGSFAGLPPGANTARYLLDDVRVFEQALSASEVMGLYAFGEEAPYFYIEPINAPACSSNEIRFNFTPGVANCQVTVKKNGVDLPAGGNVTITQNSVVISNPTAGDFTNYTITLRNGCGSVSKTVNAVQLASDYATQGLVRYFPFNNNVNDAMGGPALSAGGFVNYTTDRFGNANSAYQQISGGSLFLPTGAPVTSFPFTICFWMNNYPTNTSHQLLSSGQASSVAMNAQNQFVGFNLGGNNTGFKQQSVFTGGWRMLTVSFDGLIVKIYSNDQLISVHRPMNATTHIQNFINALQADIDDIRIYNRVLAEEEVRGLYGISNISAQPQNQSICEGQTANLSVSAQATLGNTLSYQWTFNGNPISNGGNISGATTNNLQITNAQASNAGTYNCIVSSECSAISSSNVTLTVGAGNVNITQQPQNSSVCQGSSASFSITTQGATVTYQWKKNGVNIGGATNTTLNLTNVNSSDAANYTVDIIGGSCGTITSQVATLTVLSLPSGAITPASPSICQGESITLTASGGSTYGWDNSLGTGDTKTVTPSSTTTYSVVVTGANSCQASASQTVTVVTTPAPTGSASQTFCNSATVANLTATGTAIQWYAASTGGSALASGTALINGTTYYASQTITGCQSATRFAVTVTINAPAAPTGTAAQTFCNAGTVANLTATGTAIQWYAASTGGSALASGTALINGTTYYASQTITGCQSATRFAVTVTINAPAAPTGTANQTFCNSATIANLTATGTAIQWYAASTGGTALSAGTSLTNGTTYYASQTITGCQSATRFAVTVTINAPAAPTGTAAQTFCNSATVANLTATGTAIQWYAASTGGTALASGTALINGTTYYASQTITGCQSATRFAVTVTINAPAAPTGTAAQTFCNAGTVANLTATGTAIQWYAASTGGSALASGTVLINGTTYYASQTITGCQSATRLAVTVTIGIPNAPTGTASQTFCNAGTVANLTATGTAIQWYAASTGGTELSAGTSLTNGTTYYASQTAGGCESTDRFAVTVTIIAPATPTGTANQEFCNAATVADLTATGSGIEWYTAPSGGTALASGITLSNGTYYASQTLSGCESANRLAVTVTVNTPAAPTGTTTQSFCGTATLADITVTGANITWYNAASAGTVLGAGTALADGATYFASQTVNGCESLNRLAVTATVNAIPAAPTATASQEFCNGATVADLTATGSGVQWFTAASGGTALTTGTTLASGSYFVSQTVNGCESNDRTEVAVNIITPATPTGNATQNFCSAATVADLAATGTAIQWYTQATGGTALATGTALSNGTYYATQTINTCESDRLAVAVTVTILNSTVAENGLTLTANQTGAIYTWVDCNNGNQPIAGANGQSFTPTANGSYAVEIELNGCTVISSCVQISSVGLEEDKLDLLTIQPNPTSAMLMITVSQPTNAVVSAANGKVITTLKLEGETVLDASKFATGVYYLRTSEGQTVKFIKQ